MTTKNLSTELPVNVSRKPILTWWALLIIAAWTLIHAVLFVRLTSANPESIVDESLDRNLQLVRLYFSGGLYGLASGGIWVATVVSSIVWRRFVQAAVTAAVVGLLSVASDNSPVVLISGVLGMVVSQVVLFQLFAISHWSLSFSVRTDLDRERRQFTIGNVVTLTVIFAGLFAVMRLAETRIDAAMYWAVLTVCWVAQPVIAGLVYSTATGNSGTLRCIGKGLLAVALVTGLVLGLGFAQFLTLDDSLPTNPSVRSAFLVAVVRVYAAVMVGFFASVCMFAITGWLSRSSRADRVDCDGDSQVQPF
ncbi:hypothetical protein N9N28_01105 [Rubripirellula amarantea]|nr:hypothetical protein [Rubripirellula amarantea]